MANNITLGYIRVSSKDQNPERQYNQMKELGINERYIFCDKESGKNFDREQYQTMIGMLREGDLVYFTSLDRMGRNYNEMAEQWRVITKEKKCDIVILDMADLLDTRKNKDLTGQLISDMVVRLLSYVAEKEREHIKKRQAEGIAIAKAKGVYTGRKAIEVDKVAFASVFEEVLRGERTNAYAMQKLGLKRNTYYKAVQEYKRERGLV